MSPLLTPISDDELRDCTRRLRHSDRAALSVLFRALYADLVRYARSLASEHAEDQVQEAFVRLWERRATLDQERSLRAYLFVTVRHGALNANRQIRNRRRIHASMMPGEAAGDAVHDLETQALEARLQTWIAALPERRREAFELSRFAGLSLSEIGAVMNISPKTAENHITMALKELRSRLHDFDPDLMKR